MYKIMYRVKGTVKGQYASAVKFSKQRGKLVQAKFRSRFAALKVAKKWFSDCNDVEWYISAV